MGAEHSVQRSPGDGSGGLTLWSKFKLARKCFRFAGPFSCVQQGAGKQVTKGKKGGKKPSSSTCATAGEGHKDKAKCIAPAGAGKLSEQHESRDHADDASLAATSPTNGAAVPAKHVAQIDSASSTYAASFMSWARQQSSIRNVHLEEFVVEHCRQEHGADLNLDRESIAKLMSAVSIHDSAVAPDGPEKKTAAQPGASAAPALVPFTPYNGWVKGAPKPHCHADRIIAADGINTLRQTRDGEIEGMLRLLCKVFEVETATVALLTGEAIYITGACGALPVCICPDRWGFCGWSFLNSHHELLVVEDMTNDARFSDNFFVCEPEFHIEFYVAAPLITANGHRLGTLCVMGQRPGKFDVLKGQLLSNLAELLVRQLEERWVASLRESNSPVKLMRDTGCYKTCQLVMDLSSSPWSVLHMNERARTALGVDWGASYDELANYAAGRRQPSAFNGLPVTELFCLDRARLVWGTSGSWEFQLTGLTPAASAPPALPLSSMSSGDASRLESAAAAAAGLPSYSLTFRLATADGLDEQQPFYVGVPSWLKLSEDNSWGRNYFFATLECEQAPGSQEQQVQPAQPFGGDSAEQLSQLSAKLMTAAGLSTSSSSEGGSAAGRWAPRDLPLALQTASSSANSTPGSVASAASRGSSAVAAGGSSSAAVGPVVRGLPVPGLVMGPLLGRGSYGKVYRGLLKGHPVAVKIIDDVSSLRLSPTGEPLEVSLTKDIKHMGVMATLGYTYSDSAAVPVMAAAGAGGGAAGRRSAGRPGRRVCWMLFEYCDRGVLVDAVIRGWFRTNNSMLSGAANLRTIGLTALEIAVAMKHLYDKGVMHGDLCGGNVMLCSSDSNPHGFAAKVGDFGLVRIHNSSPADLHPVDQRLQNNAYGTITHMPPEVLRDGGAAFTPAADVYAWGVLLWEMLTGSRAWSGMAAPAVVCQVAVLGRGLAIPPKLPPVLQTLLQRALSAVIEQRPSFAEIVEQLTHFVQGSRAVDWQQWQQAMDDQQAADVAAWKAAQQADGGAGGGTSCGCPAAAAAAAAATASQAAAASSV